MKHKLAIGVLTQHKWNRLKRTPSRGSLERDLAAEDHCNSRMDEVNTNAKIVIITFLNARLSQCDVPKL